MREYQKQLAIIITKLLQLTTHRQSCFIFISFNHPLGYFEAYFIHKYF